MTILADLFSLRLLADGLPGTGGGNSGDSLVKLLSDWDLSGAKTAISGLVRALGFGPEADGIATVILGIFILLVIIGYAAGPSNRGDGSGGKGGGTVGTEGPPKNK